MTNDEARAVGLPWKHILLLRQRFACCWCGRWLVVDGCTLEHIIPKSLGGTNDFENLAVAHYICNSNRSSNIDLEPHSQPVFDFVRERLRQFKAGSIPAKRPRLEWRNDDGEIVGLSPQGER